MNHQSSTQFPQYSVPIIHVIVVTVVIVMVVVMLGDVMRPRDGGEF